jgi:hypothetical protein
MKLILIAREECRQEQMDFRWSHLSSTLGCCSRGEGEGGTKEEQRRRREKERDGKGLVTVAVYIEKS